MLNQLREILASGTVNDPSSPNGINLAALGGALARVQGSQPGAGCSGGCCGGSCDAPQAVSNGNATAPGNLDGLLGWLAPQNGTAASTAPQNGVSAAGGPQSAAPQGPGGPQGGEGQWGPEDEQMLDKAINDTGGGQNGGGAPGAGAGPMSSTTGKESFNHIFEEFGQSQEGNCASIAVIKAAMDKYKGKVFNSVSKQGDGYSVSLQDGGNVQVSKQDLATAAKHAKLKSNKPSEAKSMAILMYAVIGKQAAKENGGNFESALSSLGKGKDPRQVAKWLGLGNKIREVNPNDKGQEAVVAWNGKHAVYIDDGTKADSYGQAKAADGTDTRGGRLTNAFAFV